MRSTGGEARTLMCGTPNPSRTIVTWPSSAAACREEVTSGSAASRSLAESTMFGDRAFQPGALLGLQAPRAAENS